MLLDERLGLPSTNVYSVHQDERGALWIGTLDGGLARYDSDEHIAVIGRAQGLFDEPVVFIGPFEHHSNELPWRESIADVVVIREDADGHVSLEHLERELERHASRRLKIGSFSAASNVTGIATDTIAISTLLHRYGALSFWDFDTAGQYVDVEMNDACEGADAALAYKDAVFLSPHKFIGGPGTPGVLVVKKALLRNCVLSVPSGGTVVYVNPQE